jgi:hypothetical protein
VAADVDSPSRVLVRDDTFKGIPGIVNMSAAPGEGTAVRVSEQPFDPTGGRGSYEDVAGDVLRNRDLEFTVRSGVGTLRTPDGRTISLEKGSVKPETSSSDDGGTSPLVWAAVAAGVVLIVALAALGWQRVQGRGG